jgi:hypothetical protein
MRKPVTYVFENAGGQSATITETQNGDFVVTTPGGDHPEAKPILLGITAHKARATVMVEDELGDRLCDLLQVGGPAFVSPRVPTLKIVPPGVSIR